jgi:hypothetical protein
MRLNSDKSLELGRALLREHDGDWQKVAASGYVREDGVIVVKRPAVAPSPPPLAAPRRASANGR